MDVPTVLRLARQTACLSQRQVAAMAGVSAGLVGSAEAGRRDVSARVLDRLLEACDLDLELVTRRSAPARAAEVDALSRHLLLSTTQRLYLCLGGTTHWSQRPGPPIFNTLICARDRALAPGVAVGLWLPERVYKGTLVDATVPREEAHHVAVRVGFATWIWAAPPLSLVDAASEEDARLLRVAADMLAMTGARDEGGRRPPPHRTPDEFQERVNLGRSLTYDMLPTAVLPDGRDSRGWRLEQPVSLRQLLIAQGLPPRPGSQRR